MAPSCRHRSASPKPWSRRPRPRRRRTHGQRSRAASAQPHQGPGQGAQRREQGPAFRLPRDGGDSVSLADFAGQEAGDVLLPARGHAGLHHGGDRLHPAVDAFAEQPDRACSACRPTREAPRKPSATSMSSSFRWFRTSNIEMLEAYGAWGEKSMYGRTFLGIIRTTVLVGKTAGSPASGAM